MNAVGLSGMQIFAPKVVKTFLRSCVSSRIVPIWTFDAPLAQLAEQVTLNH
jgi:hypothetical protein